MNNEIAKRESGEMKDENAVKEKSKRLAVRIVRLYEYLRETKHEDVMSKQMLRSGTSIGANVHEGVYAQSKRDFVTKMSIALKEASETEYWLELLKETEYIAEKEYESIHEDCVEVIKILTAIVRSAKEYEL